MVVKVDLPTPPLPDKTRILWRTEDRRAVMIEMSGSGPFGAEAHMAWLGQPAQAEDWPAVCDSGPGQCSSNYSVTTHRSWSRKALTRFWSNKLWRHPERGTQVDRFRLRLLQRWGHDR